MILALAGGAKNLEETIDHLSETFAEKGYRMLGVARSDAAGAWTYIGVLAFHDPPRPDSAATIKTAEDMGLDVKMVTGDHVAIAREVAREVNLKTDIVTADAFSNNRIPRLRIPSRRPTGLPRSSPSTSTGSSLSSSPGGTPSV